MQLQLQNVVNYLCLGSQATILYSSSEEFLCKLLYAADFGVFESAPSLIH